MKGLRTTIYLVNNLKEASKWYEKAFGTKAYFNQDFYVGFNIGGYELGLLPSEDETDKKTSNVLSYWGVDDISSSYQKLLDLGAKPHEAPNNVGGEIIVASVLDPWGNTIGIIYNPEFKLEPV